MPYVEFLTQVDTRDFAHETVAMVAAEFFARGMLAGNPLPIADGCTVTSHCTRGGYVAITVTAPYDGTISVVVEQLRGLLKIGMVRGWATHPQGRTW